MQKETSSTSGIKTDCSKTKSDAGDGIVGKPKEASSRSREAFSGLIRSVESVTSRVSLLNACFDCPVIERGYTIFGSPYKGGETFLIGFQWFIKLLNRKLSSHMVHFQACMRPLRIKCMAIGRLLEEEKKSVFKKEHRSSCSHQSCVICSQKKMAAIKIFIQVNVGLYYSHQLSSGDTVVPH
ncbi:hypothetical protein J6590_103062 [Homalodisca vitripennis]|nr:hypothetical protein J6590_036764 [Homalodisca vitripennis]KAG8289499.1 hypothetical protein J6590_103062 [Homalodisca vitripennis]